MKIISISVFISLHVIAYLVTNKVTESNFIDEHMYINICKSIASLKHFNNEEYHYEINGRSTLFILSNSRYVTDPDKKISVDMNGFDIAIWFRKDLFIYNIPYWIEIQDIEVSRKHILLKIRSFNAIDVEYKKPVVMGDLTLRVQNTKVGYSYTIVKENIKIIK